MTDDDLVSLHEDVQAALARGVSKYAVECQINWRRHSAALSTSMCLMVPCWRPCSMSCTVERGPMQRRDRRGSSSSSTQIRESKQAGPHLSDQRSSQWLVNRSAIRTRPNRITKSH